MATQTDVLKVTAMPEKMSLTVTNTENADFYWVCGLQLKCADVQADQEEPHRTRRQLIQKAHPEVAFPVSII